MELWHMDFIQAVRPYRAICILTMRDSHTRKQFQGMENTIYFQSLFTQLVIASHSFTILKTKTV